MEEWQIVCKERKCIRIKDSINFSQVLKWECYNQIMLYMINYIIYASHSMILCHIITELWYSSAKKCIYLLSNMGTL